MPSSYPAPAESSVESLLAGFVSVPTHVTHVQSPEPERDSVGVFAEFVDDETLAVLAFVDQAVVNAIGGTIGSIEADTIIEAISKATVLAEAVAGFREVIEGLSACIVSEFTKPVTFRDVHPLPGQLSEDIKQLWRQPGGRRSYRVSVEEYTPGTITLLLA
jgi:hypothetical protein